MLALCCIYPLKQPDDIRLIVQHPITLWWWGEGFELDALHSCWYFLKWLLEAAMSLALELAILFSEVELLFFILIMLC